MKKWIWILAAVLIVLLVVFVGLKLSGVNFPGGFSFSMGGATTDNGSAQYSGKTLAVTVDAGQTWSFTQSGECVTLDENMPVVKDGKATYTFTASADGECTLTFTGGDGKTLTASFAVVNAAVTNVKLK